MHVRHEGYVYESKVLMTNSELELPHCLYKGCGLDIADRSAKLNDAEVRLLARFIYRNLGYPFYPVLNGVCDVGDNLAMMT
jgi:hypothetical protein